MQDEFKPSKLYWQFGSYEGHNVFITTQSGLRLTAYLDTLMDRDENETGEGFILDDVSPSTAPDFILLKDIKDIKTID